MKATVTGSTRRPSASLSLRRPLVTHVIRAAKNAGATITDVGDGGGSLDAAADTLVTVDGVVVTAPGWVHGLHVQLFA
jgi:hypothetical protein